MTYLHFNPELQAAEPCEAPTPEDCPLGLWTVHSDNAEDLIETYRAWLREGEGIVMRYYSKTELRDSGELGEES